MWFMGSNGNLLTHKPTKRRSYQHYSSQGKQIALLIRPSMRT